MAPQISQNDAEFILREVAAVSVEPWMEFADQLEQRYRIWGFTKLDLQVPDDITVRELWEVVHRFHLRHPEAYAEVTIFDPTLVRIVQHNPLQQR